MAWFLRVPTSSLGNHLLTSLLEYDTSPMAPKAFGFVNVREISNCKQAKIGKE
jgi:hypothetical protein